ncbi:hypothetical protein FRC08_003179 [Ceratobasidium sp. 394]|nr:hypothetical protein FRC08_003179 [Ceratobasidium sp. 394]
MQTELLHHVAILHDLGFTLVYQDERPGWQGGEPGVSPLSPLEIDTAKAHRDMKPLYGLNTDMLRLAYDKRIVLDGFNLRDFLKKFHSRQRPAIKNGHPFKHRKWIKLRRSDGPCMVVSEDGYILLLSVPGYLDEKTMAQVGLGLDQYCALVPPTSDVGSSDSRANQPDPPASNNTPSDHPIDPQATPDNQAKANDKEKPKGPRRSSRLQAKSAQAPKKVKNAPSLKRVKKKLKEMFKALARGRFHDGAGSFHQCLLWIARGQEGHMEPVTSTELKKAFRSGDVEAVNRLLYYHMWKQVLDQRINDLVRKLHLEFFYLLKELKKKIRASPAPPQVLWDVWGSLFTFQAVGFNRETEMHRDSAGMEGGLDVLFLLGKFEGGNLKFQDLAIDMEWQPGDLCMFDGKLFSHGVSPWEAPEGGERRCFIYFVHASVLRHFGLSDSLSFPHISRFAANNGFPKP